MSVDGDVGRPIELDFHSLRNLPAVEAIRPSSASATSSTSANWRPSAATSSVRLTGRARDSATCSTWRGPQAGRSLARRTFSADEFTMSLPLEVMLDPDTLLVYEMNGQPLSRASTAIPSRVLIPGRYGMKSAKWVVGLRASASRGRGLVRPAELEPAGDRQDDDRNRCTGARRRAAARRRIASPGIAYAGDRGISKVEFSADEGETWRPADLLEPAPGQDAWVRWQGSFTLQAGEERTLVSRATDGTGALQIEEFSLPQPNGSSGWHHAKVRATSA